MRCTQKMCAVLNSLINLMRLFLYCVSWNKKIKVFDDVVAISVFVVAREESQMNGTAEWIALALIKNRLNDKCMFNKNKRIRCSTNNNQQHATCVFCLSHWTRPKKEKWMNEWPHEKWLLMKFQTYCFLIVFFGHCFSLFSFNTHKSLCVANATIFHNRLLLVTNSK